MITNIDIQSHTAILLGSLNKAFKDAKRKGTFSVRDLYFLHCIYRTIKFGCEIGITGEQLRALSIFYFKIIASSDKFCMIEFQSNNYKTIGNFTQTTTQTNEFLTNPTVSDFVIDDEGDINFQIFNDVFNDTFS